MSIRAIGALLCGGILVLASVAGGNAETIAGQKTKKAGVTTAKSDAQSRPVLTVRKTGGEGLGLKKETKKEEKKEAKKEERKEAKKESHPIQGGPAAPR